MLALVVPVRLPGGGAAVLKMQPVDAETAGEPVALRAWDGRGAVRLLDHDPDSGALLLEALDAGRDLERVDLDTALTRVGELLGRLHAVSVPEGVRGLGPEAVDLAGRADRLAPVSCRVGSRRSAPRKSAATKMVPHTALTQPQSLGGKAHVSGHQRSRLTALWFDDAVSAARPSANRRIDWRGAN